MVGSPKAIPPNHDLVYVTTFDAYEKTAGVRREVFGDGPYPAATGVKVAGLIRDGALIEIRAVAWLG